jgi:hypothetical protein
MLGRRRRAPAEKPTNGAVKKPGALQQPAAEKVLKGTARSASSATRRARSLSAPDLD